MTTHFLSYKLLTDHKNVSTTSASFHNLKRKLVFIKVFKDSKNLIIKIKDNADRVPKEAIDKIFNAYYTKKRRRL